ncbi:putative efflux protein, MATE family [Actinokineospora alba]|uniref:Putative efflux protein, MATE family n=1 Tax=Actinokineospora alba TaxID=504798 RepID=A0A1H0IFA3_9PSEU|nr:MATE family efflux transporter [Actinokineospora alba]TDP70971.1 putative MATE family efflux protein [Actinokineospora alba]SDI88926.1 putative efflux protein, MATE family [Actinokineospora alba]SDO30016.1 putative efflux protein, MATE family [Actinokineospora alba]
MGDLRQVLRLALPALPVLAAEPLYLLVDTAVVGHLGAMELGALGVGAIVLAQLSTQLTFLSYGTTARAARLHGAGRRADAVAEGIQATWLALAVGIVIIGVGQLLAGPIARALAGPGDLADAATGWLRIALLGVPMILVTLAGNGWMRGVQDTGRPLRYVLAGNATSAVLCPFLVHGLDWGLDGSAVANVAGQLLAGALFLRALLSERVERKPHLTIMRAQLVLGRDLILRSLAFQACFVSAAAVAARTSVGAVGAHQVVLQLWTFLALVLDSLAIAAQALVGAALGAGDDKRAKVLARKLTGYGLVFGAALGIVFAALAGPLPRAFTTDSVVLQEIPHAWWFFVALQPIAGVVFALDGVLLGAGDARFLRTATLASAIVGFLPLVWISHVLGWGLVGIWTGLSLFMVIRLATILVRVRAGRWAVVGAST